MSREGEIPSWSSAPSCSVESRTAPHISASLRHRSRVTIKPCSPSAAFHGEAGVFRRYALLLIAARCPANPRCALHRLPIVLGSRLKPCSSPHGLESMALGCPHATRSIAVLRPTLRSGLRRHHRPSQRIMGLLPSLE